MKLISFLILVFTLYSCSWQEYFVVENQSMHEIEISYELDLCNAFQLFDEKPDVYELTKEGEINWDKKVNVADQDSSKLSVKLLLKPKSILLFGRLCNDHYEQVNQKFINGREFNLKKITIKNQGRSQTISKVEFDSFFKKKNGLIAFQLIN